MKKYGNPSMREILVYSHDVITVSTFPSMYANVTNIRLIYSMLL